MKTTNDITEIGGFSVFTNIGDEQKQFIDYNTATLISSALQSFFDARFEAEFSSYSIRIGSVQTSFGCVITAMTISVGAIAAGVYKLITDYDKVKANIRQIISDAKWLWVKVVRKKEAGQGQPGKTSVSVIMPGTSADDVPDSPGVKVVITRTEIITYHKTALMKDDIVAQVKPKGDKTEQEDNKKRQP